MYVVYYGELRVFKLAVSSQSSLIEALHYENMPMQYTEIF